MFGRLEKVLMPSTRLSSVMTAGPVHYPDNPSGSSDDSTEIVVDTNLFSKHQHKLYKQHEETFVHDFTVYQAISILLENNPKLKYRDFIQEVKNKLEVNGIQTPIQYLIELFTPLDPDFPPVLEKSTDLIKALFRLGYFDPDLYPIDDIFHTFRKKNHLKNVNQWKVAYKMQVMNNGKGFDSKQVALRFLNMCVSDWSEHKINSYLHHHFRIPQMYKEVTKHNAYNSYKLSELKNIDEKYGGFPFDLDDLEYRIEKHNIEISDSLLILISKWVYGFKGVHAYLRKRDLQVIRNRIVAHLGREPEDPLELEKVSLDLGINLDTVIHTTRIFFQMKSITKNDILYEKGLEIKRFLGKIPENDAEIIETASELGLFMDDSTLKQLKVIFKEIEGPVEKVYQYFYNTTNNFSFLTLPYSEQDIIKGLKRWLDNMDTSDQNKVKILKERLVPDDIINEVISK